MNPLRLFAFAALLPLAVLAAPSPYAGQENRDIKALSAQKTEDLLQGRGIGFAKAAELNAYPGPAHALELAPELGLSAEQQAALHAIKARMTEDARRLGAEIVQREQELDRLFRDGKIDAPTLAEATAAIARATGRLREVHLQAHLETKVLLTEAQVRCYDRLRGYAGAADTEHDGHRHGK